MKPTVYIKDDFNSLLDYQRWLKDAFGHLSDGNASHLQNFSKMQVDRIIRSRSDWFGNPHVTYEELEEGVKEYQRPELLESLYQKVQDSVEHQFLEQLKARKLRFNSLGFGMFCFDRAAMTLYRNKEYYSQSLKKTVDPSEIQRSKKGYVLSADRSPVTERWEQTPEGKPKVRTQTKDVFAFFPEEKRDKHAVEFFISCNASFDTKGSDMLYGGISAVIMAEILIKAGIKVKINTVIGSAVNPSGKEYVGSIVPIKHYDEPLDRNLLALMSSDPRFMRYDGFKGVIASYNHFNKIASAGYGYAMSAEQLKAVLENSGYTKKLPSAHRYYFGGTFNEKDAIRDIKNTIEDMANHLNA